MLIRSKATSKSTGRYKLKVHTTDEFERLQVELENEAVRVYTSSPRRLFISIGALPVDLRDRLQQLNVEITDVARYHAG